MKSKYKNWNNVSVCRHVNIGSNNGCECIKCGRRIVIDKNGIKRYYLISGYNYRNSIPEKMRS